MPKSKIPRASIDGRRNNSPPVEHQIAPGEVRNPHGRRGKPKVESLSSIEDMYLSEAERVVSHGSEGPVTAAKRLIQEEFQDALVARNPLVRARLLDQLMQSTAKAENAAKEFVTWVLTCKAEYTKDFYLAKKTGRRPPDVMHPDHVHIRDGRLVLTGPVDREARERWEHIKAIIKIAAWLHQRARSDFQHHPSEKNGVALKEAETHRRWVMRCVPKGWNWREDIYCRGSQTKSVQEMITGLERVS